MDQNSQKKPAGSFIVNRTFEATIEGQEPMWTQSLPAKTDGNDGMTRRAFKLAEFKNVLIEIPNGVEITVVEKEGVGTYGHCYVNGDVHLLGALATATKPGHVIKGNVLIYILVWEPEGARVRGGSRNGRDAYANYAICIDVSPCENPAVPTADYRLEIVDTTTPESARKQRDIVEFDSEGGRIAHISRDRLNDPDRLRGRDQDIIIRRIERADDQPITTPLVATPVAQVNPIMNGQVTLNGRGAKPIGGGALADQLKAAGLDPEQFRVHIN